MIARSVLVVAAVCVLAAGCGTADLESGAADSAAGSTASAPASATAGNPESAGASPDAQLVTAPPAQANAVLPSTSPVAAIAADGAEMDRAAIEGLVKDDLARYLGVPAADIAVTGAQERAWIEGNLGCGSRDIGGDTFPVQGYLLTLEHGGAVYPYHTDRAGNFVRCPPPGKPIGPITR